MHNTPDDDSIVRADAPQRAYDPVSYPSDAGAAGPADPSAVAPPQIVLPTDLRLILALAGAILLFFGTFLPLVSIPVLGSINYFGNGKGDGVLLIIAAVVAVILASRRLYHWLIVPGAIALVLLGYTAFTIYRTSSALSDLASSTDNPFAASLGAAVGHAIQLQWGWAVMGVGAGLLLSSGALGWRSLPSTDRRRRLSMLWAIGTAIAVLVLAVAVRSAGGSVSNRASRGDENTTGVSAMDTSISGMLARAASAGGSADDGAGTGLGWMVSHDTSLMDGSETVNLSLLADGSYQTAYDEKTPMLTIRCKDNDTEVFFWSGSQFESAYGEFERSRVRYRFDDGSPTSALWNESTSGEALFVPAAISFARRLADARKLLVEFTPFSSGAKTVSFTVGNLASRLGAVATACHWKYP